MKQEIFLFLLLLPLASAVPAPPEADVSITLFLVYADQALPVNDVLTLRAHSDFESFAQPLTSNVYGESLILLPEGVWDLELFSDEAGTPGIDYYAIKRVDASSDSVLEIFLVRAASLYGRVEDAQGKAVPNAVVSLDCVNSLYAPDREVSDEAGNYLFEFAPSGSCVITALSSGFKDSKKVSITQGSFEEVDFVLSSPVQAEADYSWLLVSFGVVIAVALIYLLFKRNGAPGGPKRGLKSEDELSLVLKSLSGCEKKAIKWLIAKGGGGKQSALQHELLIPRASLSRAIKSLERKGLVHCKCVGKANSIRLSERFYAD